MKMRTGKSNLWSGGVTVSLEILKLALKGIPHEMFAWTMLSAFW